ncbi:collagen alpha-1(XVII) chain-like [Mizuhopecten yessoensis]|uniref:collagen alpha-1(XVII) chain-like n=1 Tax=Mizuhopecten yessoensis TaxID=6573 RepID=UPI000B4592B0|nr:collagen alpha-1(XVII) chain-like [Mizuhopecten yessoensis]
MAAGALMLVLMATVLTDATPITTQVEILQHQMLTLNGVLDNVIREFGNLRQRHEDLETKFNGLSDELTGMRKQEEMMNLRKSRNLGKPLEEQRQSWNGTMFKPTFSLQNHWKGQGSNSANAGTKGDKGDSGLPGPKGDAGLLGPKGDAGLPGPKGDAGLLGPKGDAGLLGPKGDAGLLGPKGDAGLLGPKGDAGLPGPKGDTGHIGMKGNSGPQGLPGSKGRKGDIGRKGEQGVNGKKRR